MKIIYYARLWVLGALISGVGFTAAAPGQESSNPKKPEPSGATERGEGQFLGALATEYPSWFKISFLDLAEDVAEAAAELKHVVLFFHQDGCPYCNLVVERNLSQKNIEQTLREHFDVIAINMWGDREVTAPGGDVLTEKSFAAKLGVQYTPTFVFLNEKKEVALRLNGYQPPRHFAAALRYVSENKLGELSFRDYLAAQAPPSAPASLLAESFFMREPYILLRGPQSDARPLAVFFEQTECPNCRTLHEEVLRDPETRALLEGFDSVQLDMWSDTPVITPTNERTVARDWASALDVTYAPTIVFFDAKGVEVFRSDSFLKHFHTQSAMDYVLSRAYVDEPSFQRFISERADKIRAAGKDVNIWR